MTEPTTHGDIELRELTPCALCGEPLLPGNPHFYRLTLQSFIFDARAINTLAGTAQILGGNVAVAAALTDTNLAQAPVPADSFLVHQDCLLMGNHPLNQLLYLAEKRAQTQP